MYYQLHEHEQRNRIQTNNKLPQDNGLLTIHGQNGSGPVCAMRIAGRADVTSGIPNSTVDDDEVAAQLSIVVVVDVDGRSILDPRVIGYRIRLTAHARQFHRLALSDSEAGGGLLDHRLLSPCRRVCVRVKVSK